MIDEWPLLLRDVTEMIAVSPLIRAELIARGADAAHVHVIPCGVDVATLPWSPPPADGGVLLIGRLVAKKGVGDLLEAVARLRRRPRLRIVGDGPLRAELEQQAASLGVEAAFLGARDGREVRDALREASIVAMPSKRAANGDCEGLPVVSLEASAMGRPVVGYRHSGIVEAVVSGETGLLAEEGDVAGLAALLERALDDGAERERMARAARAHVERRFTLAHTLRGVERVYARACAREPAGPPIDVIAGTP
jgi:glycosyltransferase involved in cell wall biosynthesis